MRKPVPVLFSYLEFHGFATLLLLCTWYVSCLLLKIPMSLHPLLHACFVKCAFQFFLAGL